MPLTIIGGQAIRVDVVDLFPLTGQNDVLLHLKRYSEKEGRLLLGLLMGLEVKKKLTPEVGVGSDPVHKQPTLTCVPALTDFAAS
jgi:hypothetical protein